MAESDLASAAIPATQPNVEGPGPHHAEEDLSADGASQAAGIEMTDEEGEGILRSNLDNGQSGPSKDMAAVDELDEVDLGAPEVLEEADPVRERDDLAGLDEPEKAHGDPAEVQLDTPEATPSLSSQPTLIQQTDPLDISTELDDSHELDDVPLSASSAGPSSRPTSRQSHPSRSRSGTPPPGRPPKPRASDPPRPLSPSRYRPYGQRQSSASSSRPSSANDNHLDSPPSTPSRASPPPEVLNSPRLGSGSPSPVRNESHAMERSASTSSRSASDETPPSSATHTPRQLAGPSSQGFKSISPRSVGASPSTHTSPSYRPGQRFGNDPRFVPDIATYSPGETAPRSMPFKPALPTASLALNGQARGVDGSAPFESIELNTGSPIVPDAIPHSASVATFDAAQRGLLPTSANGTDFAPVDDGDKKMKRRSWGGFGIKKPSKSQSLGPPLDTERRHSSAEDPPQRPSSTQPSTASENAEAGPSSPRRKHAPPAHPHPFPIPTSPPLVDKRDSTTRPESIHSTIQPKSPTITQTNGVHSSPAQGLGIKGVSTFEKVISHTRPSWLPPKAKEEDDAHYHQWEEMMTQAREAEAARRKIQEARRLEREKKLGAATPRWEALLGMGPGGSTLSATASANHLKPNAGSRQMSRSASGSSTKSGAATPNGTHDGFSVDKVKSDPSLRRLWFEGVPSHLRGRAWQLAIGNPLALSKDAYKTYQKRAQRALDSGRFPEDIMNRLDEDMDKTLPHLRLFVPGSPMRQDLRDFVCAWVVYRSDTGNGYAPYITHLSAMFLLTSPPAVAFHSLVNFLSRPCLHAFYTETRDEIDAYYRVFENLQADKFPKIFANCKNLGLKLPESYFRTVFLEQVSFESCCRLWDQIVLDGDGYIFRAALAIFGFLEPRLHFPDKEEIESVLEGRNRATLAIIDRERERARLKGEVWDDTVDGTLSVFGLNEDALFDWLETDDWKESRFERLVSREMPD